jgi:putative membrane protein
MAQITSETTIQQYPLDRKKITKKIIVSMIFWTIFLGIGMIVTGLLALSGNSWMGILFFTALLLYLIIFFIQVWYQTQYYNKYFYNMAPDFLVIKKGVILVHETMLPYEKLQDVYMDQDIFDRMFGLWDVHVSTATAMSAHEAHIDGLSHENADKLREVILTKIRNKGV